MDSRQDSMLDEQELNRIAQYIAIKLYAIVCQDRNILIPPDDLDRDQRADLNVLFRDTYYSELRKLLRVYHDIDVTSALIEESIQKAATKLLALPPGKEGQPVTEQLLIDNLCLFLEEVISRHVKRAQYNKIDPKRFLNRLPFHKFMCIFLESTHFYPKIVNYMLQQGVSPTGNANKAIKMVAWQGKQEMLLAFLRDEKTPEEAIFDAMVYAEAGGHQSLVTLLSNNTGLNPEKIVEPNFKPYCQKTKLELSRKTLSESVPLDIGILSSSGCSWLGTRELLSRHEMKMAIETGSFYGALLKAADLGDRETLEKLLKLENISPDAVRNAILYAIHAKSDRAEILYRLFRDERSVDRSQKDIVLSALAVEECLRINNDLQTAWLIAARYGISGDFFERMRQEFKTDEQQKFFRERLEFRKHMELVFFNGNNNPEGIKEAREQAEKLAVMTERYSLSQG